MNIVKATKDQVIKRLLGKRVVPRELLELNQYFPLHGGITFEYSKGEDGNIIAKSTNFRYGSIVTSGKDMNELDRNIKDAILTSFGVPSAYAKDAALRNRGTERESSYALA